MEKGEVSQGCWFRVVVWVMGLAVCLGALAMVLRWDAWVWVAALGVVVVCIVGVGVRGYIENRGVVWTEEERRRFRERQGRETVWVLWSMVPVLVTLVLVGGLARLVEERVLPVWAACVGAVGVLVVWVWLWRWLKRRFGT